MDRLPMELDETDRSILAALRMRPRGSLTELSSAVGIARGTLYSRLDRLTRTGVIIGYGPDVDPRAAGFGVLAFCTLEIQQGTHDDTVRALADIPELLEIHTVTGAGDLLCRIIARSNDDLHEVLQRVTSVPSVRRSQTQLALATSHRRHVADLFQ